MISLGAKWGQWTSSEAGRARLQVILYCVHVPTCLGFGSHAQPSRNLLRPTSWCWLSGCPAVHEHAVTKQLSIRARGALKLTWPTVRVGLLDSGGWYRRHVVRNATCMGWLQKKRSSGRHGLRLADRHRKVQVDQCKGVSGVGPTLEVIVRHPVQRPLVDTATGERGANLLQPLTPPALD